MRNRGDYVYQQKEMEKSKNVAAYLFFGIAVFLFIYFPFFGINLRYVVGNQIDYLLNMVGTILVTLGGISTLLGFIRMFLRSRGWINLLIFGVLMLWMGCWMTGAPLNFLPGLGGDNGTGIGYH